MKNIIFAILLFAILPTLLFSSCSKKIYVPIERVRTVVETVRDTVVEIRLEKQSDHRTTRDTTSTVSTAYATSTATWHASLAELEHSISTLDTPVKVAVKYVDRLITDSVPVPYPVYVDRDVVREKPVRLPLRWWERAFMWSGAIALLAVAMWLIYKLRR